VVARKKMMAKEGLMVRKQMMTRKGLVKRFSPSFTFEWTARGECYQLWKLH